MAVAFYSLMDGMLCIACLSVKRFFRLPICKCFFAGLLVSGMDSTHNRRYIKEAQLKKIGGAVDHQSNAHSMASLCQISWTGLCSPESTDLLLTWIIRECCNRRNDGLNFAFNPAFAACFVAQLLCRKIAGKQVHTRAAMQHARLDEMNMESREHAGRE